MVQRSPDNQVNRAIQETAESSNAIEELVKKLSTSTEMLSQSSERIENLSEILIILTFAISSAEFIFIVFPEPAFYVRLVLGILYIFVIFIAFFYRRRPKRIFQEVQKSLFK